MKQNSTGQIGSYKNGAFKEDSEKKAILLAAWRFWFYLPYTMIKLASILFCDPILIVHTLAVKLKKSLRFRIGFLRL